MGRQSEAVRPIAMMRGLSIRIVMGVWRILCSIGLLLFGEGLDGMSSGGRLAARR